MAGNIVQTLRSGLAGARPSGRKPGELYTNFADGQIGVVDASGNAVDLLAVTVFSPTAIYNGGDFVVYNMKLYRCGKMSVTGPFAASDWYEVPIINQVVGQWSRTSSYAKNDMVTHAGDIWRSIGAQSPTATWDGTKWAKMSPVTEYDPTHAYAAGDTVWHGGSLYKAGMSLVPQPFNPNLWWRYLTENDALAGGEAVTVFDPLKSYSAGDFVKEGQHLYRARTAITAKPFSASEWDAVITFNDYPVTAWDASKGYASGSYVTKSGSLYRSTGAVPPGAPWTDTLWHDITPVQNYSQTTSYLAGSYVIFNGQMYRANKVVAPGQATPAADDWDEVGGGGAQINVGDTAPADRAPGDLWWNSTDGNLYIYYDDGTTEQWVCAVPSGDGRYVTTDGSNATGTWGISISGNAATATRATNADNATHATTADSATTATTATSATTATTATSATTADSASTATYATSAGSAIAVQTVSANDPSGTATEGALWFKV